MNEEYLNKIDEIVGKIRTDSWYRNREKTAQIIYLYLRDKSFKNIAEILDMDYEAVRGRANRAAIREGYVQAKDMRTELQKKYLQYTMKPV